MADFKPIKVHLDSHLVLEQPFLRLPYESARNNFKAVQRQIEQAQLKVTELLTTGLKHAENPDQSKMMAALDQAISRLRTLQNKLETLDSQQSTLLNQSKQRIQHLSELERIESLSDVKYDEWSKTRLDRLLIDYLVRNGYALTATSLAETKHIKDLVDIDTFVAAAKIENSLRVVKSVELALTWCAENKMNLKKIENDFQYQLRLQQYIELLRTGIPEKLLEATKHAKKYLLESPSTAVPGLMAYVYEWNSSQLLSPYKSLFSEARWDQLADQFVLAHRSLNSLPLRSLLSLYLTAGLSSLKTPCCHSKFISPSSGLGTSRSPSPSRTLPPIEDPQTIVDDDLINCFGLLPGEVGEGIHLRPQSSAQTTVPNTPICPICSTELNDLARNLPYANHRTSQVDHDLVALPNGRIYSRAKLEEMNERMKAPKGHVMDPLDNTEIFKTDQIQKVFVL